MARTKAITVELGVFDQMLRAQVLASMKNKRRRVPAASVFKRLEARHLRRTKVTKRAA
jgi:hypothetical protein